MALREDLVNAVKDLAKLANGYFKYLRKEWNVVVIPTPHQALEIG